MHQPATDPRALRRVRPTLALLAVLLVAVACGGDQPSAGPPLSFVPDQSLLAVMPSTIHGASCTNEAYSLAQFMNLIAETPNVAQAYQSLTEATGVGMDKISVGSGTCNVQVGGTSYKAQYEVFRATGASAGAMWRGLIAMTQAQGNEAPVLRTATVGGRSVTAVIAAQGDIAYVYESGALLFFYPSVNNATVDDLVVQAFP